MSVEIIDIRSGQARSQLILGAGEALLKLVMIHLEHPGRTCLLALHAR